MRDEERLKQAMVDRRSLRSKYQAERDDLVRRLCERGDSVQEIATRLGKSRHAAEQIIYRLGMRPRYRRSE